MKKEVLLYTDEKKYSVVIAERHQFAIELNAGVETIKNLPFLPPDFSPSLEVIRNPLEFWRSCILEVLAPKQVNGFTADPAMLAKLYGVDYEGYVASLTGVAWTAASMLEYVDGVFKVTPKVKKQVEEQCSIFVNSAISGEFAKLDTLLDLLNEYTGKYVTGKNKSEMHEMAGILNCKYIQLPDHSHKIVPDYREAMIAIERVESLK